MKEKPLILITNDDGYTSKGIIELAKAAKQYGDVVIAAPKYEQSSTGRGLTRKKPISVEEIKEEVVRTYAIDATPATCVVIALNAGLLYKKPDLVLSGINNGENLSSCITLSGTIGAAIEAASYDIPAIAFSLQRPKDLPGAEVCFEDAAKIASKFIKQLLNQDIDACLLNINIPYEADINTSAIYGEISNHKHYPTKVSTRNGNYFVDLAKSYEMIVKDSDADIVLNKRRISITPLDYLIGKN